MKPAIYVVVFRLKALRSCQYDVHSPSNNSRGGPDGSGGKYSPVASIWRCVWELLIKIILQTWELESI